MRIKNYHTIRVVVIDANQTETVHNTCNRYNTASMKEGLIGYPNNTFRLSIVGKRDEAGQGLISKFLKRNYGIF